MCFVGAAYALGFLDCDNISARCMLSIFQFFATKTDASVLRMLNGAPGPRLLQPIADYVTSRGARIHTRTGCRYSHAAHPRTVLQRYDVCLWLQCSMAAGHWLPVLQGRNESPPPSSEFVRFKVPKH